MRIATEEFLKVIGKTQELANLMWGPRLRPIMHSCNLGGVNTDPLSRDNVAKVLDGGSIETVFLQTGH